MNAGAIAGIVIAVVVVLVVGVFKFLIGWKEVRADRYELATHYAYALRPRCEQPSFMRSLGKNMPELEPGTEVVVFTSGDGEKPGRRIRGTVTSQCKNEPHYYSVTTNNGSVLKSHRPHLIRLVSKK